MTAHLLNHNAFLFGLRKIEEELRLLLMMRLGALKEEKLVREDGLVAATTLPFDKANSEVAFETATFGMG